MRLIFVRHGHPNYRDDCLTDLGHLQAEAAAERLQAEGIRQIYSSTCGRAFQTAEHTARKLGIADIIPCEFMREIGWGTIDGTELFSGGHPWMTAENMVTEGYSLLEEDWMVKEPFRKNIVTRYVSDTAAYFDALLAHLGYRRDGLYYRVGEDTEKTIAVFSHGGSSSAVISHLLNLPFPFLCGTMPPDFTAISILTFSDETGSLISPKVELFNDARHIAGLSPNKAAPLTAFYR